MLRQRHGAISLLALAALLAGCTTTPESPADSAEPSTDSSETVSPTSPAPAALTDEHGVLTAEAVAEIAPAWGGSTFQGDIQALPGYDYGGDCQDSAWDVLYLFESAAASSTTFQATSGAPAPTLVLGVIELSEADRERDLAALTHQVTACIGESPDGEALQQVAPAVGGWSGLRVVAEDRDIYWTGYAAGIVVAELQPAAATQKGELGEQARAILSLQLDQLG